MLKTVTFTLIIVLSSNNGAGQLYISPHRFSEDHCHKLGRVAVEVWQESARYARATYRCVQ